jgi:beta-arrestin
VQYKVKVKLVVAMGSDLSVELPFTLTHPKPPPSPTHSTTASTSSLKKGTSVTKRPDGSVPVDLNLIQFDTNSNLDYDDDLVFEEFARIRLKGHEGPDDTDA